MIGLLIFLCVFVVVVLNGVWCHYEEERDLARAASEQQESEPEPFPEVAYASVGPFYDKPKVFKRPAPSRYDCDARGFSWTWSCLCGEANPSAARTQALAFEEAVKHTATASHRERSSSRYAPTKSD